MVQLTTSVVVAALLAAPSLAAPFHVGQHAEHHADSHLEAREPRIRAALGKARKVVTSGRVGAAAEVASAGATVAATQQTARDLESLEELAERDPIFGKVFKVAKKVVGGAAKVAAGALSGRELEEMAELSLRELDELEELAARDPRIRAALGKAKKAVTSDRVSAGASVVSAGATIAASQQAARDLEELEELATREPIFGKVFKVAKKVVGGAAKVAAGALSGREFEEMQELALREFDDFEELATREPIFGKVFKVAKKVVGGAAKVAAVALSGREFEEMQELALRELDFEELTAREPRIRAALGKAKKVVTSGRVGAAAEVASAGATIAATQQTARDLEALEVRLRGGRLGGGRLGGGAGRTHIARPAVERREPRIRAALGKARKVVTSGRVGAAAEVAAAGATVAATQQTARDFEDLSVRVRGGRMGRAGGARLAVMKREPRIGGVLRKARKVVNSGSVSAAAEVASTAATVHAASQQPAARELSFDDLSARDLEELEELAAREPIFGKVFKVAKKVVGGAAKVAAGALSGRDLESIEELAAREYFDSEIDQLD